MTVAGLAAAGAVAMARRQSKSTVVRRAAPYKYDEGMDETFGNGNFIGYNKDPIPPYGPVGQLGETWMVEYRMPEPTSAKMFPLMVGASEEINDGEPWDPMGFHKLFDRNFDFNLVMTYPHIQWLREAELKHGRVCMLAFVGMVVQSWVQIPGYPQQPDWEAALWECYADKNAQLGLVQISIFAFIAEGYFYPTYAWIGKMDREPGDLGFDPLGLSKRPGFDMKRSQLVELKNGRLAMVGVASVAAAHALPGSVPLLADWAGNKSVLAQTVGY